MRAKLQNLILALALVTAGANAHAFVNPCPAKEKLAAELLELELAGRRYPSFADSCVNKLKSKAIWVRHDPVDDPAYTFPKDPKVVSRKDKVRVTSVKKSSFPDRWVVTFQWNKKTDSFVMETFAGALAKSAGCAAVATPPKGFYVYADCVKK